MTLENPLFTPLPLLFRRLYLHHPPFLPLKHRTHTRNRKDANISQVLHPPPHRPPRHHAPNGQPNQQPLPHLLRPLPPQAPSRHNLRARHPRAGLRLTALRLRPACQRQKHITLEPEADTSNDDKRRVVEVAFFFLAFNNIRGLRRLLCFLFELHACLLLHLPFFFLSKSVVSSTSLHFGIIDGDNLGKKRGLGGVLGCESIA